MQSFSYNQYIVKLKLRTEFSKPTLVQEKGDKEMSKQKRPDLQMSKQKKGSLID